MGDVGVDDKTVRACVVAHTRRQRGWNIHHAQHIACVDITGVGQRIDRHHRTRLGGGGSNRADHRRVIGASDAQSEGGWGAEQPIRDGINHQHVLCDARGQVLKSRMAGVHTERVCRRVVAHTGG